MASARFPNFGTAARLPTTPGFKVHGTSPKETFVKPITVQSAFVPKKSPLETAGQFFTARLPANPKIKPALADAPVPASRELPRNHVRLNTGETADRGVLLRTQSALEVFEHRPPEVLRDLYLAAHDPKYIVYPTTLRALEPYSLFNRSGRLPGEVAASVRAIIKMDGYHTPRLVDPLRR